MRTEARARANRANALASTGLAAPRASSGWHRTPPAPLAVPVATLAEFDEALARLTQAIAGEGADARHLELARRAAEARMRYCARGMPNGPSSTKRSPTPNLRDANLGQFGGSDFGLDLQFVRHHRSLTCGRSCSSMDATMRRSARSSPPMGLNVWLSSWRNWQGNSIASIATSAARDHATSSPFANSTSCEVHLQ